MIRLLGQIHLFKVIGLLFIYKNLTLDQFHNAYTIMNCLNLENFINAQSSFQ